MSKRIKRIAVISDYFFSEWDVLIEALRRIDVHEPYELVAIPNTSIGQVISSYAELTHHPLNAFEPTGINEDPYSELLNTCDGVIAFICTGKSKIHDLLCNEIKQGKPCDFNYFNFAGECI